VRFADHDGTRSLQRLDGDRVLLRDAISEPLERGGRPQAGRVVEVLDAYRNPVKWTLPSALPDFLLLCLSPAPRSACRHGYRSVHPRLKALNAIEARGH